MGAVGPAGAASPQAAARVCSRVSPAATGSEQGRPAATGSEQGGPAATGSRQGPPTLTDHASQPSIAGPGRSAGLMRRVLRCTITDRAGQAGKLSARGGGGAAPGHRVRPRPGSRGAPPPPVCSRPVARRGRRRCGCRPRRRVDRLDREGGQHQRVGARNGQHAAPRTGPHHRTRAADERGGGGHRVGHPGQRGGLGRVRAPPVHPRADAGERPAAEASGPGSSASTTESGSDSIQTGQDVVEAVPRHQHNVIRLWAQVLEVSRAECGLRPAPADERALAAVVDEHDHQAGVDVDPRGGSRTAMPSARARGGPGRREGPVPCAPA